MSRTPPTPPTQSRVFAYTREQFQGLVEDALKLAKSLGSSDAAAEVSEGVGLSVSVRKGEIENVERNRDKSMGITVYVGQRRGNASTSDFSRAALEQTVRAAHDIARFTAEDAAAGLPDAEDIAVGDVAELDLDLFHPWGIDAEGAAEVAKRCEAAAFAVDRRITNSEGAGVSAQQSHFYAANSRGFAGGYPSSRHSISVAPIASTPGSQRRRHATRCLVHVDAVAGRTGGAGSGRPLCRGACAVAPAFAQDQDLRGAGAVRIGARHRPARCLRAGDERRIALSQVELPAGQPRPARDGPASRHPRGSASRARQGQRTVRR
jgi:hypothetical protein